MQLETWKAPENNKRVICDKLVEDFADREHVLEIGSGTGQHAVWFAKHLPHLVWQTSDREEYLEFITQRLDAEKLENTRMPVELDVTAKQWPAGKFDGIFAANCIHIMGWQDVLMMFEGMATVLEANAKLALYGPFKYGGEFTTPSNAEFDLWLKSKNQKSGIRDFEDVDKLANNIGLTCLVDHAMPANNQLIIWGS